MITNTTTYQCEARPSDPTKIGRVFGSSPYSADSAVCPAAVHAGIIPATGGFVEVVMGPEQPRFVGSTRNGITTENWNYAYRTYTFVRGCY